MDIPMTFIVYFQDNESSSADMHQSHEVIVVLPKKIDSTTAAAFMNKQGQIKV